MKHEWYVAFVPSERLILSLPFVHDEQFGHVFCFADTSDGVVIQEFDGNRITVRHLAQVSAPSLGFDLVKGGAKVLSVTSTPARVTLGGLLYCVSVVKSCIGLRGCYAITPFGLYQHLKSSPSLEVYDLNEIAEKVSDTWVESLGHQSQKKTLL